MKRMAVQKVYNHQFIEATQKLHIGSFCQKNVGVSKNSDSLIKITCYISDDTFKFMKGA